MPSAEPLPGAAPQAVPPRASARWFAAACALVLALAATSLFVGVADLTPDDLLGGDREATMVLLVSRVPRTLALILAGMALSVVGLIMQMLTRNRFVEPSTAGTVESAGLGIVVVLLIAPGLPVYAKTLVAAAFAMAGTALFLRLLRPVRTRSALLVPLIGLTLTGVFEAMNTFLAYRYELLQAVSAWMNADFSSVIRGRYELLWAVAALTLVAYLAADRFTVAGLGEEFTTSLGLDHRRVLILGVVIASLTTAVIVATVGAIPFLGLVVPNIAALIAGDHLRRTIPWVAVLGAGLVLLCDLLGRLVRYPYEIPIGLTIGVVGSGLFLYLLLRRPPHAL